MSTPELTRVDAIAAQRPSGTSPNADLTNVQAIAAQSGTPNARLTFVRAIAAQRAQSTNGRLTLLQAIAIWPNKGVSSVEQFGLSSRVAPAFLLDVLTVNNKCYRWSSHQGSFPIVVTVTVKIAAVNAFGLGSNQVLVTLNLGTTSSPFSVGQTLQFGTNFVNATFLNGLTMVIQNQTVSPDNNFIQGTITSSDSSLYTAGNIFGPVDEGAATIALETNDPTKNNSQYQPYVVSAGPFQFSRSLSRNGGQIVVQNISGNTIERDVLKAMRNDEFEGALAVFRLYDFILGSSTFEFHGILSQQTPDESKVTFNLNQLIDPTLQNVPARVSSNLCTWIYKSDACGSTGTADNCPKTPEACKDPRRNAFQRFNGFGSPPLTQISSIQYQQPQPVLTSPSRKAFV